MAGTTVIGVTLIVFGGVIVIAGLVLIVIVTLTALGVYLKPPKGGAESYAASGTDWAKLLEALSKLPQWMLAIIVGNAQILMGYWLLGATLFGQKFW